MFNGKITHNAISYIRVSSCATNINSSPNIEKSQAVAIYFENW